MKNKKNKEINSFSIIYNGNNDELTFFPKNISFSDEKKKSSNKSNQHYCSRRQKSRQINSLDELTKKFMKCVQESESNTINLNTVMKKIKVKKRRIYDITNVLEGTSNNYLIINFIHLGIGLIKKGSKNEVKLLPEFYDLYLNQEKKLRDELEEKNNGKDKNILEINKYDEEINYVNYLTNVIKERLLLYQSHNIESDDINNFIINNGKRINIPYKELSKLNYENSNNIGFITAKSESGLKVELAHVNDPKNIYDQKKMDMNLGKLQYNEEYLNSCGFSNRLYITSNNNCPINVKKIEPKIIKNVKEKEEVNNFQFRNENENLLNSNNCLIYYNNENKCDISFGSKNNHNDNKFRKDSLVTDFSFSFYGNLNNFSFNSDLNNLFNYGFINPNKYL